jgi:hypothetical protein
LNLEFPEKGKHITEADDVIIGEEKSKWDIVRRSIIGSRGAEIKERGRSSSSVGR